MTRTLTTIIVLVVLLPASLKGQDDIEKEVLLTVNGKDITAGEFLWLYRKNSSLSSGQSIDEYLPMFILFKQKVEDAIAAGYNTKDEFKKELAGYRKQLAVNYLTDRDVKEKFLKNAYERYLEEINVYHILVKCPPDAKAADTLRAYEKALNIRERIKLGEPFKSVARGASDDPTAFFNGGNLGYFTVFQTPLNFENAVYSMKPGMMSMPVRTAEGYHIIKVQDRRRNSGRVKVSHIMKATPPGSEKSYLQRAKAEIDSLHKLILAGEDFSNLASKYSDDKGSASNGGSLPWFGVGEMVHEFSEQSFSLMHNGDISKPFRTIYGWHIVKRENREDMPAYEQARKLLESKLSQSYLQSLSRKSFADKLKKEYDYKLNDELVGWFCSIADSSFRAGNHNWDNLTIPEGNVYSFANKATSVNDFINYLDKSGQTVVSNSPSEYISALLDIKSYEDLVRYEDSMLEKKYPEFRYLVNEFHDGILMFWISEQKIWSKITGSQSELKDYWETRQKEFVSLASMNATIVTVSGDAGKQRTKNLVKEIRKMLRSGAENIPEAGTLPKSSLQYISQETGNYNKGESSFTDNIKWSEGVYTINRNSETCIVRVNSVNPSRQLGFDDAKEFITDDFIRLLETRWDEQLRSRYPVTINNKVLNVLKQEIE